MTAQPHPLGCLEHHCHAVGCNEHVPPKMLMCRRHWFMVPGHLRRQVWATYRPGQEVDKAPSKAWHQAADAAIAAVYAIERDRRERREARP